MENEAKCREHGIHMKQTDAFQAKANLFSTITPKRKCEKSSDCEIKIFSEAGRRIHRIQQTPENCSLSNNFPASKETVMTRA
jgi:hypothetical protein